MQDGLKRVLDYSDYLAAPEDGKRYEILRGDLLVTPAPRPAHQRALVRLVRALGDYFDRHTGEVFVAPIDLILTNHDVLQPDLLVVDDPALVTDRGIEGAPLLIVEILSKTTAARDRGVKARRYAQFGIRHYWLVDPDARRVECHKLVEGAYDRVAAVDGSSRLSLLDFPRLDLPLATLWTGLQEPAED
jgi:Uma2 family endonuclease